jgi:hypothetical protein
LIVTAVPTGPFDGVKLVIVGGAACAIGERTAATIHAAMRQRARDNDRRPERPTDATSRPIRAAKADVRPISMSFPNWLTPTRDRWPDGRSLYC